MSQSVRGLGRLASNVLVAAGRESKAASEAACNLMQRRFYEAGRYSPKLFSREAQLDRGSSWMPKNPFIEAWYFRRDKYEREFSWTARNVFELVWFLGGLTAGFYALSVFTMRQSDSRNGYPKRDMLGASTNTGFVLPDEREFY